MNLTYQADGHTYVRSYPGNEWVSRALSHPSQLPLIRSLSRGYVEVCSVNQLDMRKSLDPDYVLDQLSEVTSSPDMGGWRPLGQSESCALEFAKAGELGQIKMPPSARLVDTLNTHPLVRGGVGFGMNGGHPLSLLHMMSEIYDIRRFSHPLYPNRLGRLRSYFGLAGPRHFFTLGKGGFITPGTVRHRTFTALNSWFVPQLALAPPDVVDDLPFMFLYREFFEQYYELLKTNAEEKARSLALWKITLRFLSFVYQLWLSTVSVDRVFEPERFFKTDAEVNSFKEYIDVLDRALDNSSDLL